MSAAVLLIVLAGAPSSDGPPDAPERAATVLLITSDELAPAWADFAAWKTALGKPTRIVTVEEIVKGYEGEDTPAKIRACVLEHVAKSGTRWIILGGDSAEDGGVVPDRDSSHVEMRYGDIPTDIYFLSRKSWDANGDGVYGSWKDDLEAIEWTHPDACIGRIPVRTPEQVRAYTKKVIAYESRYPGQAFATRFIQTCPERGAYPKLGTSLSEIVTAWKHGTGDQFFANKSPWDGDRPGDHDLKPKAWVEMINAKSFGKMHMHGHGLPQLWVLERRSKITPETLGELKNEDAYVALTTVSCFTGQYDKGPDPCITEQLLRLPDAGAVLVVAPSREGVPVFHDPRRDFPLMMREGKMDGTTDLLTRFWKHALKDGLSAGEALSAARADLVPDATKSAGYHWCLCELNLLGDPTLDLRSRDPRTPELRAPDALSLGEQSLRIGTGIPEATVCAWKGDEVYEVAACDADGVAEIAINPRTAGTLLVTVSGRNLNVVRKEIPVSE